MIDSGEHTIAKRFCTDSIKNAKRLTLSALRHQYDFPSVTSECYSGTVQTAEITIRLQNKRQEMHIIYLLGIT